VANKSAWLTKRIKLDGKWTTKQVVFNSKMVTNKVVVNGENRILDGVFVLEWYEGGKRRRRAVGEYPYKAQMELQYQQRRLADMAEGRPVVVTASENRHPFGFAVTEYIAKLRDKQREEKTIRGIEQLLQRFFEITGRMYVEDISHEDLTKAFVAALRREGLARQTVFDRFARMIAFQNFCSKKYGIPKVATLTDGPDRPKARVSDDGGKKDAYSQEELEKLFSVCTDEENFIWTFFIQTGARERELMHATWKDINLQDRVFFIRENKEFGFRPKDRSDRTVPFAQSLADALAAVKTTSKNKSGLIFPNKHGKPRRHLIRVLKQRALEAGLNCGFCVNSLGESCTDKPVCELHFLHRLRHHFAITHLRNGVDPATIQAWMGHSDLATTNIYLNKIRNTSDATKAKVDSSFARNAKVTVPEERSHIQKTTHDSKHPNKIGGAVILESTFVMPTL
jgi:integrase